MPSAAVAGHYEIFNTLQNKTGQTEKTLDILKQMQIAVKMSDGKHLERTLNFTIIINYLLVITTASGVLPRNRGN